MYHDRIDTDEFHHNDVTGEAVLQLIIDHRVAAVLNYDGLTGKRWMYGSASLSTLAVLIASLRVRGILRFSVYSVCVVCNR